jgi:hypothetical protein
MSASGNTPPPNTLAKTQAQTELIEAVRSWVHFDNLAESLNKQVNNVRSMRTTYEEKVLRMLENTGMRNAVLQITGATLQRQTRVKPVDLSWSLLEEQLHEYYKINRKQDETSQIIDFIQKNRGSKSVEYLKKTSSADISAKKNPS